MKTQELIIKLQSMLVLVMMIIIITTTTITKKIKIQAIRTIMLIPTKIHLAKHSNNNNNKNNNNINSNNNNNYNNKIKIKIKLKTFRTHPLLLDSSNNNSQISLLVIQVQALELMNIINLIIVGIIKREELETIQPIYLIDYTIIYFYSF